MRFKNKLASALLIQPLGVGSLFFTVWYLGNYVSIELQGYFSALKSQIDLLVAILIFGLPQSVIYQVNSQNASRQKLIIATALYALAGSLILVLCDLIFGEWIKSVYKGAQIDLIVILAIGALVFHRIARGIFVTVHDDWRFSVVTISPMLVLAFIVILGPLPDRKFLEIAYLLSSVGAVVLILFFFRGGYTSGNSPEWRMLWANGIPVFLQSVVMASQPVLIFAWIRHYTDSFADVAHFSVGLYAYNAGVLPITMVAPLLFNRWSSESAVNVMKGFRKTIYLSLALIPVVLIGAICVPWIMRFIFSEEYTGAISSVQIMLCAIPFAFITLFSMPAFMSVGKFSVNTWLAILRLTTMLIALFVSYSILDSSWRPSVIGAVAWLCAEITVVFGVFYAIFKNSSFFTKIKIQ